MGSASGFNAHLAFYVVLQSPPSIGEMLNLSESALLQLFLTYFITITAANKRLFLQEHGQCFFLTRGSVVSFELI